MKASDIVEANDLFQELGRLADAVDQIEGDFPDMDVEFTITSPSGAISKEYLDSDCKVSFQKFDADFYTTLISAIERRINQIKNDLKNLGVDL